MFCRSCGEKIPVDSVFCPNCGKNLLELTATSTTPINSGSLSHDRDDPPLREESDEARVHAKGSFHQRLPRPRLPFAGHQLEKLLWAVGLLFSAVGFIIGVADSAQNGIVWMLFGLSLVIAASHRVWPRHNSEEDDQEAEG